MSPLSFVRRYLEPADGLNEALFGLIMVLSFTLTAGLTLGEGPDAAHALLLATLGCNLSWGIIDGVMFLMGALLVRSRQARALAAVHGAPDEATGRAVVHRELEDTLVALANEEERRTLDGIMHGVARRLPPRRARLRAEDWYGALASCALVLLATLPAAVPFLLLDNARLALRVSNALLLALLFVAGRQWGVHAFVRPWLAGLAFVAIGLALVGLAIVLGG